VNEIPLNKPALVGNELQYVAEAARIGHFSGPGFYTKKCEELLEKILDGSRVLVTASCGTALELAAAVCGIREGDEVILPAFTHPATANAFLKRGPHQSLLIFARTPATLMKT
jgi:dTDP-4-amino-4,6-dideoxygalactose transaminase